MFRAFLFMVAVAGIVSNTTPARGQCKITTVEVAWCEWTDCYCIALAGTVTLADPNGPGTYQVTADIPNSGCDKGYPTGLKSALYTFDKAGTFDWQIWPILGRWLVTPAIGGHDPVYNWNWPEADGYQIDAVCIATGQAGLNANRVLFNCVYWTFLELTPHRPRAVQDLIDDRLRHLAA